MSERSAALRKMDDYLRILRESLRGLPARDAEEIVEELRSHLLDSNAEEDASEEAAAGAMDAALRRLGPPRDLAAQYVLENLARRAARSRTPWFLLGSCYRWAVVSVRGLVTLALCLLGYGLSVPFVLAAVLKLFRPDRVGLWKIHESPESYSLGMGFGTPLPGRELLGWWIVPLGLLAGTGLFLLTTRLGLWNLRRFSPPGPGPGGGGETP